MFVMGYRVVSVFFSRVATDVGVRVTAVDVVDVVVRVMHCDG